MKAQNQTQKTVNTIAIGKNQDQTNQTTSKVKFDLSLLSKEELKKILDKKIKEEKEAKEKAKQLKAIQKASKVTLISAFNEEFKNPFKLYNFYTKNIKDIQAALNNENLPELSKEEFFNCFDKMKELKKANTLNNLNKRLQEAQSLNQLDKVNTLQKSIITVTKKEASSFTIPFTLNSLLKAIIL